MQNPNPTIQDPANTRRLGDTVSALTGVLSGAFGAYRIHPTASVVFSPGNSRPAAPEPVGGRLRVGALNVLNFFTTLDTGSPICGPMGGLDCRGANTAAEFNRQREKLLNELQGLNPDVAGLMEVENNSSDAVRSLVDGLNARIGTTTFASRHWLHRHRRDQGRAHLQDHRRPAVKPFAILNSASTGVHRHQEPAVAGADLRGAVVTSRFTVIVITSSPRFGLRRRRRSDLGDGQALQPHAHRRGRRDARLDRDGSHRQRRSGFHAHRRSQRVRKGRSDRRPAWAASRRSSPAASEPAPTRTSSRSERITDHAFATSSLAAQSPAHGWHINATSR